MTVPAPTLQSRIGAGLRDPWIRRGLSLLVLLLALAAAVWHPGPHPSTPPWPQRQPELTSSAAGMAADYTRTAEQLGAVVKATPRGPATAVAAATAVYFDQLTAAAWELRDAVAAADSFPDAAWDAYTARKLNAESVLRKRLSVITAMAAREGHR